MLRLTGRLISHLEDFLAALCLSVGVGAIFLDVALRTPFKIAFSWSNEFTRYAIVWMVFIGGSIAARKGFHINIDILQEILPRPFAHALNLICQIASLIFCSLLFIYGVELVIQMKGSDQRSPAMEIPMYWVYLAIPLGGLLMGVRFVERTMRLLREYRPEKNSKEID
jgi:C4-dicarboxylate transporter DctQ subunit